MPKNLPPDSGPDQLDTGAAPAATAKPPAWFKGDAQLNVILPNAVVSAVKARAAERDETLRVTVLRALAADGYDIDPADLDDRGPETGGDETKSP